MYCYVHIPFCKSKCTYCDFFSVPKSNECLEKELDVYIDSLLQQSQYEVTKHSITKWNSLYIGGGTPSLLNESQVTKLLHGLLSLVPREINAEVTFEANPCDIAQKGFGYLENLYNNGINRISCGIQALDDDVLKNVQRRATKAECIESLKLLRQWQQKYSTQFSVDAIAGLPGLSNADFLTSLKAMMSYNPNHISMYSLMIEEGTELCNQIENGQLDYDYDFTDEQWLLGLECLKENGYYQYEVSNFAKNLDSESTHNKSYWRMDNYVGIGCTACGTIGTKRYTGTKNISNYCNFWSTSDLQTIPPNDITIVENLTQDEQIFEFLMMGFRTVIGVDSVEFEKRFGITLEEKIGDVFSCWEKENLAYKKNSFFALTESGLLQLNRFLSEII